LKGTVNSYVPPPVATMTEKFLELNEFDMDLRIHDEGRQVPPYDITSAGPVMQDDNVKVTCALVDHPPIKMALAYRFDTANRSVVFLRQYPKDRLPDRPRQSGRCPGLRRAIPPWNSRTCRPAGRPRIYSYARRPRSNPAGAAALLAHPIVSTSDPELPLRVMSAD
jgi:hypothetical protein